MHSDTCKIFVSASAFLFLAIVGWTTAGWLADVAAHAPAHHGGAAAPHSEGESHSLGEAASGSTEEAAAKESAEDHGPGWTAYAGVLHALVVFLAIAASVGVLMGGAIGLLAARLDRLRGNESAAHGH